MNTEHYNFYHLTMLTIKRRYSIEDKYCIKTKKSLLKDKKEITKPLSLYTLYIREWDGRGKLIYSNTDSKSEDLE